MYDKQNPAKLKMARSPPIFIPAVIIDWGLYSITLKKGENSAPKIDQPEIGLFNTNDSISLITNFSSYLSKRPQSSNP